MEDLAVASRETKEEDYLVVKVHENELLDIAKTSQGKTRTWEGRSVDTNLD